MILSELERAVELARSGEYAALCNLIRRLRDEGFSDTALLDLLLERMKSPPQTAPGSISKPNHE
jgi:hypothetical protein